MFYPLSFDFGRKEKRGVCISWTRNLGTFLCNYFARTSYGFFYIIEVLSFSRGLSIGIDNTREEQLG